MSPGGQIKPYQELGVRTVFMSENRASCNGGGGKEESEVMLCCISRVC